VPPANTTPCRATHHSRNTAWPLTTLETLPVTGKSPSISADMVVDAQFPLRNPDSAARHTGGAPVPKSVRVEPCQRPKSVVFGVPAPQAGPLAVLPQPQRRHGIRHRNPTGSREGGRPKGGRICSRNPALYALDLRLVTLVTLVTLAMPGFDGIGVYQPHVIGGGYFPINLPFTDPISFGTREMLGPKDAPAAKGRRHTEHCPNGVATSTRPLMLEICQPKSTQRDDAGLGQVDQRPCALGPLGRGNLHV
jgi:hypothetical protein